MKFFLLVFTVVLINFCYCAELSPNFRRCDVRLPDFNRCLSNSIQNAITQLRRPIPTYNIPCIDPFTTRESSGTFGNPLDGLRSIYNNFNVFGFTNINSTNASFDPVSRVLSINITFNGLFHIFDFRLQGRFMTIPMNVLSPNSSLILVRPTFQLAFVMEEVSRNGTQYYRAINSTLNMVPEQTIFNYTRIFGDRALDDAINARIQQEGNGALDYLQGLLPNFWTQYFIVWLNNVLDRVPIQNLFEGM